MKLLERIARSYLERSDSLTPPAAPIAAPPATLAARSESPIRQHLVLARQLNAARVDRWASDWLAACVSPDDEVRGSHRMLRARARELADSNPYVMNFLRLLKINVNGPHGPRLQVQPFVARAASEDSPAAAVEMSWRRYFGGKVTTDRRLRGLPCGNLVLETLAREGEVFARKVRGSHANPHGFAWQFIDPDLVDENYNVNPGRGQNEIRMGVEVDADGAPVAYWCWPYSPNYSYTMSGKGDRYRVPAEEMEHIFVSTRANQTRGKPWLLSAMIALRMIDKYEDTEAMGARAGATVLAALQPTEDAVVELKSGEGEEGQTSSTNEATAEQLELNPLSIIKIPFGHTLETFNPQHPSNAFQPFRKGMLQKSASGLGPAYTSLANDLEGVSFSSGRIGKLAEQDFYKCVQALMISEFYIPWYEGWLPLAFLSGQVATPEVDFTPFLDALFHPRGWPWVDPWKDVMATKEGIAAGLTSRTIALAEQGLEVEQVFQDLAREKALAEQYGISLESVDAALAKKGAPTSGAAGNGNGNGNGAGDEGDESERSHRKPKSRLRDILVRALAEDHE